MVFRWVTVAGWLCVGLAVVTLSLGLILAWREFVVVGVAFVVAAALGILWMRGRVKLGLRFAHAVIRSEPGRSVAVELTASAPSEVAVGALDVDIPVGPVIQTRRVGRLRAGEASAVTLDVATPRRMVIPVGPVTVVRRDPLGLYERRITVPVTTTVVVHPDTVGLPPLSAGFVRDLEGETSRDLTDADLSFHALREYVAGDDRRHIHWRSSAKTGRMMMRQYEQTRRSRMMIVCDTRFDSFLDDDEFELAVSVAASLGVRALRDSRDVAFAVAKSGLTHANVRSPRSRIQPIDGIQSLSSASPTRLLDDVAGLTRAEVGPALPVLTRMSVADASDVSIVFVVTGSLPSVADLQLASLPYGAGVEVVALRCAVESSPGLKATGRLTLGTIGRLDDVARLLMRQRVTA